MKNRIKVLLALLMLCGTTQSVRAQDGGDMNNHLLRINDYVPKRQVCNCMETFL